MCWTACSLLTEVEALRRFVLVRGALLRALQQTGSKGMSLGRELCDSLRGMIGEAPEMVKPARSRAHATWSATPAAPSPRWPSSAAWMRPSSD